LDNRRTLNHGESWTLKEMTQDEFIAILFDDLGFTAKQRKDYLKREYGVQYADELPVSARSRLITDLKGKKENGKSETAKDLE
jgi:hypothetical protein